MLFRHPQGIAPEHEVPAHRGMPGRVWFAIADRQTLQGAAPARVGIHQVADRLAGLREEQTLVVDAAGLHQAFA